MMDGVVVIGAVLVGEAVVCLMDADDADDWATPKATRS